MTVATLLATYGPAVLTVLQQASAIYTDRGTRRAAQAQVDTENARTHAARANARAAEDASRWFNQHRHEITSREARIPRNAFNSSTVFTQAFVAAAIMTLVVEVHQGVQALKRIGLALEDIHKEIQTLALARVQGWSEKGYGYYIYKLLKSEIHAERSSEEEHMFYVYNPDTVWHTDFEQHLEEETLPASFGGYSADLDAIFLLMWTNRQTLIQEDEKAGKAAVFHLLVPTYYPYAVDDRLVIDESLCPLVIKGHRFRGRCLTYFRFYQIPEDVILRDVVNLHDADEERRVERNADIGVLGGWMLAGVGLCLSATGLPFLGMAIWASGGTGMIASSNSRTPMRTIRILGPPTLQEL